MPHRRSEDPKAKQLRHSGTLHPHPDHVRDDLFLANEFFDARDLLQVRYEMLRRHQTDRLSVSQTVRQFGVSRPTFYTIADLYELEGVAGLVPRKRGPKGPRPSTRTVLEYVQRRRAEDPALTWEDLKREIAAKFGASPHRRTVERGLAHARASGPSGDEPQPPRRSRPASR